MITTTEHPTLPWTLTHDSTSHTFTNNEGTRYTNIDQFVASFFPSLNIQEEHAKSAARAGKLDLEITAAWARQQQAEDALKSHIKEYAFARVHGGTPPHPASEQEQHAFHLVDTALDLITSDCDIIAANQNIFDPLYHLAGTLDLFVRNKTTAAMTILQWHTGDAIRDTARGYAIAPIERVPNSERMLFTLQMAMREFILSDPVYSAYPTQGQPMASTLIHIPPDATTPAWISIEHARSECLAMVETISQ